ncbi:MAG TPA: TetR/AcrR family transcriptional regulator [Caulobacteraceae bacterium]|nr:TetR/AcrR family transcriptional regulator [Caulobacteraceae bacterium]
MDASATKPTSETGAKLVAAAAAEFNDHGFGGTDTNKIARRAGFAPQTFYRWFKDKTEIFVAVYRAWEEEERAAIGALIARRADDAAVVQAGVDHHRRYLNFRRSLRRLSLEDPVVRRARAESRVRQVAQIKAWSPEAARLDDGRIAAALLTLERLTDALAEGELADMGVSEAPARAAIAAIVAGLRSGRL